MPRNPAPVIAAALILAACAQGPGGAPAPRATAAPQQQAAIVRPAPAPSELIGAAPSQVEAKLGVPAFKGADGASRIWRYSAPGCTLLVIFYEDGPGGIVATHLDARRPEGGETDLNRCLSDVVNRPRA